MHLYDLGYVLVRWGIESPLQTKVWDENSSYPLLSLMSLNNKYIITLLHPNRSYSMDTTNPQLTLQKIKEINHNKLIQILNNYKINNMRPWDPASSTFFQPMVRFDQLILMYVWWCTKKKDHNLGKDSGRLIFFNSFLNIFPDAFLGMLVTNDTRLIFLYGATCSDEKKRKII